MNLRRHRITSFDQLRFVPRETSYVDSRSKVFTATNIFGLNLNVPVICPAMDSIVCQGLIDNIENAGGAVVQPRGKIYSAKRYIMNSSIDDADKVAEWLTNRVSEETSTRIIALELNNGYLDKLHRKIIELKNKWPHILIWAGAVTSLEGCQSLANAGADAALVGIGVSSVCETTPRTGVGLPIVTALLECQNSPIPVITLGGIRTIGDIAKAYALGASLIMCGHLFSQCSDTNTPGEYWGQASSKQKGHNSYIEGGHVKVPVLPKTSAELIREIKEGLQSSLSFAGATNLFEFSSAKARLEMIG